MSIVPISSAKPGSVVRQPNQCSTAKSKKQFHNINRPWSMTVSVGEGQVKEMCLQMLLEGRNWSGWTNRQRQVVQKKRDTRLKSSSACVGLDHRYWQIIIVVWSQWTGWEWCSKHGVKIHRLFFTQGFVGRQIDLKQYSKPYWQPREIYITIVNTFGRLLYCFKDN